MAAAPDLFEAAEQAPADLQLLWQADTLQDDVIAFWREALVAVPASIPNNKPLANWLAIIAAFAPSILDYEATNVTGTQNMLGTLTTYQTSVDYVYRFCKLAYALQGQGLITNTQATALLAAYNNHLASP